MKITSKSATTDFPLASEPSRFISVSLKSNVTTQLAAQNASQI